MPLDPRRVQAVFGAVVESGAADRAEVLDRECSTDAELRRRVEALLCAHDQADSMLDRPIVRPAGNGIRPPAEPEGHDLGPGEGESPIVASDGSDPTIGLRS